MSNNQTAVEWLFNEYVDKGVITIEAIDKALEIEKEQIENAFLKAYLIGEDDIELNDAKISAGYYYRKTYEQQ